MKNNDSIAIKISGPAGTGIITLGEILSSALNQIGFFTLSYPEYPSRIRGGDNNVQIVICPKPNFSPRATLDALFTLNKPLATAHEMEVKPGGKVFDADSTGIAQIPQVKENPIVKNIALAGYIWKFLTLKISVLEHEIKKSVPEKFIKLNIEAVRAGYDLCKTQPDFALKPNISKVFGATGNEVFASSALKAGVEYASIYPMTPITSLIHHIGKTSIKMVIPEDEIFAAISSLGASYAGKRSLTATSGGGFCLMTEAVGFSGMAEIPLVIIFGQRTGPSSGLPTYTSQGDLNFAINSSHGEFPKIIFAPGDLEEIARLTPEAFNLADKYQIPVIILTDKYLSENRFTSANDFNKIKIKINRGKRFSKSSTNYSRYVQTADGISPRAYPGETTFLTSSYEHNERGGSTDSADNRSKMMNKRATKLKDLAGGFEIYGNKSSKTLLIGWGSTKTQILEFLNVNGQIKYMHIFRPHPFPNEAVSEIKKADKVIVIENNFSGQMAKIIQNETGIKAERILKDDGRPFFQEELYKLIQEKCKK
jgi:2-oxoglutarate ferredoxin oxidoreductase subunit alpha